MDVNIKFIDDLSAFYLIRLEEPLENREHSAMLHESNEMYSKILRELPNDKLREMFKIFAIHEEQLSATATRLFYERGFGDGIRFIHQTLK